MEQDHSLCSEIIKQKNSEDKRMKHCPIITQLYKVKHRPSETMSVDARLETFASTIV